MLCSRSVCVDSTASFVPSPLEHTMSSRRRHLSSNTFHTSSRRILLQCLLLGSGQIDFSQGFVYQLPRGTAQRRLGL